MRSRASLRRLLDRAAQPGSDELGAAALHLTQQLLAHAHAHGEAGLHVQRVLPWRADGVQDEIEVVGVELELAADPQRRDVQPFLVPAEDLR